MLLIIIILVAVGVITLLVGLLGRSQSVMTHERLIQVTRRRERIGAAVLQELSVPLHKRILAPWLSNMLKTIGASTPGGAVSQTRLRLNQAGYPAGLTVESFMALRGLALIIAALLAGWLNISWHFHQPLMRLSITLVIVAFGAFSPQYALDAYIRKRQAQIRKSLPDIMDLMVVSTEAGVGLDSALQEVVKRRSGPLVYEFDRLLSELRLGKPRAQAWQDLADRTGVEEVRLLVSALLQADELGVSIGKTLRTQANALRQRRSSKVRVVAATMSVKMLFPMIFFIFPALLVVVLGPAFVSISTGFKGAGF
jgi:tight adherence protein C